MPTTITFCTSSEIQKHSRVPVTLPGKIRTPKEDRRHPIPSPLAACYKPRSDQLARHKAAYVGGKDLIHPYREALVKGLCTQSIGWVDVRTLLPLSIAATVSWIPSSAVFTAIIVRAKNACCVFPRFPLQCGETIHHTTRKSQRSVLHHECYQKGTKKATRCASDPTNIHHKITLFLKKRKRQR